MKFTKILSLYLFFFICLTANSSNINLRARHHLKNSNTIDFKDTPNGNKPSKNKIMESIIKAKSTSVIAKSNENTRFKEQESLENSNYLI